MGRIIPWHDPWAYMLPGDVVEAYLAFDLVVASYGAAVLGSLIALELLARRTSGMGTMNMIYLFLAALFMGGVGMWCMNYLANMGTIMGMGDASYKPVQSPLFAIASFVAPILGYAVAFALLGTAERPFKWRICCSGLFAGLVTVGDCILAQRGITNYTLELQLPYLVGGGIMAAVIFSIVFHGLFFIRSHFHDKWYRLIYLAFCMGLATSGTHWLCVMGTTYRYKKDETFAENFRFLNILAFGLITMLSTAGLAVLIFVISGRLRDRRAKGKSNKVTLASVTFTYDGRVMVKQDGTLPIQTIFEDPRERDLTDVYDVRRPVFQWMLRASIAWRSVQPMLPVIKYHQKEFLRTVEDKVEHWDDPTFDRYFRALFCIAAEKLANSMRIPMTRLGTLSDDVYLTGEPLAYRTERDDGQVVDLENQNESDRKARGRMYVISRMISPEEAKKMEHLGYRFTSVENTIEKLSWCTQTTTPEVTKWMKNLKTRSFGQYTRHVGPGVYLACFVLRPSMWGGFDVCVEKECHGQIPMKRIEMPVLSKVHLRYLKKYDGKKLSRLWRLFQSRLKRTKDPQERHLIKEFSKALQAIVAEIPRELWEKSYIMSEPTVYPTKESPIRNDSDTAAVVFGLRTMLGISERCNKYDFVPFQIANIAQKTTSKDCRHFLAANVREFSKLAVDAYNENQGTQRGLLMSLSLYLSRIISRISDGIRRGSHPDVKKTLQATEVANWTVGLGLDKDVNNPLICPTDGDWVPVMPTEKDARDDEGWLENFFTITTEAEKNRGPAAAAKFGAHRAKN